MWQLLAVVVFLLILYYVKTEVHRRKYAKFYNLPVLTGWPLLGNSYLFMKTQFFTAFRTIFNQTGLPCLIYLPEPHYCTANPEEVKLILNNPNAMAKSMFYAHFEVAFGYGLVFAPAKKWKSNRKLLSKAFNKSVLDSFVPIFHKRSRFLNKELLQNNDNLFVVFEKFSFDSFLESACGIFQNFEETNEKLVDYLTRGQEILMRKAISPLMHCDWLHRRTEDGKALKIGLEDFHDIIQRIINEKKLDINEITDPLARLPVLDLLMKLKHEGKYNDNEIIDEIATFAGAATDTSGYTLGFVCTLLGMHPHIQEKVFEEVITVVGPTKEIEYTDLPNLKYTEMVILESLRILPTVPLIGRRTETDIDIGHCVVPSGTCILVSIFDIHRNEKYYPNPLEFNPDRFLPEEVEKRNYYSYIPFSVGPRNCIGWVYALMLMKTAVANIVRSCKISSKHKSVTEFKFESNIVMKINPPPDCRFTSR